MRLTLACFAAVSVAAIACNNTTVATSSFTVGGQLAGLNGSLSLANNGNDHLTLTSNGNFTFATAVANGSPYVVTILSQPSNQTCTLSQAAGVIAGANVTNVGVSCITNQSNTTLYTIGGTVSGLSQSLATVSLLNGTDQVSAAEGAFTFPTSVVSGTGYDVTVATSPSGYNCTVAHGTGAVGDANVTSVAVTCVAITATQYSVGGTVSGATSDFVLTTNGTDLGVSPSTTTFSFQGFSTGGQYDVHVTTQPTGQNCNVTYGSGIVGNANVTNITVVCTTLYYAVGGSITGATGDFVLSTNSADFDATSSDTSFSFGGFVHGDSYNVEVTTQPAGQNCNVTSGNGNVGDANVTDIAVVCDTLYSVSGSISGASGEFTLSSEGVDLVINGNTTFDFPGYINGDAYDVEVTNQPSGQYCTVTSGSGTIDNANVTGVSVSCAAGYPVSGTISGATGSLTLQINNGSDSVVGGSTFTFPNVPDQSDYYVTVSVPPAGQGCTVSGGSGTVSGGAVTGIAITCFTAFSVSGTFTGDANGILLASTDEGNWSLHQFDGSTFTVYGFLDADTYDIEVYSSSRGNSCSISGGTANSGTIAAADVTGIEITCAPVTYTLSGILNFTGGSSVDVTAGSQSVTVSSSGGAFFLTGLTDQSTGDLGFSYTSCVVEQGASYYIDGANIAGIIVNCGAS